MPLLVFCNADTTQVKENLQLRSYFFAKLAQRQLCEAVGSNF